MPDSFLVLVPLALLAIVALFRFVGCAFDSGSLGAPPGLNPDLVDHWPLNEAPGETTAHGNVDGTYRVTTVDEGSTDADGLLSPASASPPLLQLGAPGLLEAVPDRTSVRIDGGFVEVPFAESHNTQEFTIQIWVHPEWEDGEEVSGQSPFRCVVASRDIDDDGNRHGYAIFAGPDLDTTDPRQVWQVWVGDGGPFWLRLVGAAVELNQTAQLAVTYDSETLKLYVDGTSHHKPVPLPQSPLETKFQRPLTGYSPNASKPLFIGMGTPELDSPAFPFKGRIQSVVLHSAALEASVIDSHFVGAQVTPE
jgi:hypothetical protein